MRILSTFFIVASVALSVDASSFFKRQSAATAPLCSNSVQDLNKQFATMNTFLNDPQREAIYADPAFVRVTIVSRFHVYLTALNSALKSSNTTCCSVSGDISTADAKALFNTITTLLPSVQRTSDFLISKKKTYDASDFLNDYYKKLADDFKKPTKTLTKCLLDRTLISEKSRAKLYSDAISKSISDVQAAYKVIN